jgi:hypothetical protein
MVLIKLPTQGCEQTITGSWCLGSQTAINDDARALAEV